MGGANNLKINLIRCYSYWGGSLIYDRIGLPRESRQRGWSSRGAEINEKFFVVMVMMI